MIILFGFGFYFTGVSFYLHQLQAIACENGIYNWSDGEQTIIANLGSAHIIKPNTNAGILIVDIIFNEVDCDTGNIVLGQLWWQQPGGIKVGFDSISEEVTAPNTSISNVAWDNRFLGEAEGYSLPGRFFSKGVIGQHNGKDIYRYYVGLYLPPIHEPVTDIEKDNLHYPLLITDTFGSFNLNNEKGYRRYFNSFSDNLFDNSIIEFYDVNNQNAVQPSVVYKDGLTYIAYKNSFTQQLRVLVIPTTGIIHLWNLFPIGTAQEFYMNPKLLFFSEQLFCFYYDEQNQKIYLKKTIGPFNTFTNPIEVASNVIKQHIGVTVTDLGEIIVAYSNADKTDILFKKSIDSGETWS